MWDKGGIFGQMETELKVLEISKEWRRKNFVSGRPSLLKKIVCMLFNQSIHHALAVSKCRSNAGLRTFRASATRLWS